MWTTRPLGGRSAWHTVGGIDGNRGVIGTLSCPSIHRCFALENKVDQFGNGFAAPLTTTDPTGGPAAWHVTGPDIGDFVQGLACPSTALCIAGGGVGLWWSDHPAGPSSSWTLLHHPDGQVNSVTCPSTSLCLAEPDAAGCTPCGVGNDLLSTHPTAGSWRQSAVATGDIACRTNRFCVGVSGPGLAVRSSTNPTGGARAWRFTRIRPGADFLRGVSCASTSFCVAVGDGGSIAVGHS